MEENLADRVTELEARVSIQQVTIDELSSVLWQQQKEADALARRVAMLESRLLALTTRTGGGEAPPDEKPPHY